MRGHNEAEYKDFPVLFVGKLKNDSVLAEKIDEIENTRFEAIFWDFPGNAQTPPAIVPMISPVK